MPLGLSEDDEPLCPDEQMVGVDPDGKVYRVKRIEDTYSCSCAEWEGQLRPPEFRTCGHLKEMRGEAAEAARIAPGDPRTAHP